MAQKKDIDAKSVSNKPVATVKEKVGKPNQTVAAIREQYKFEQERQMKMYANAKEDKVMRTIRDIAQNVTTPTISTINRDMIRGYLTGNIYANSKNLINASRYLFYRSPIYNKMIYTIAGMYCLDARMLTPDYSFVKGMDINQSLKQYDDTLNFLDIINLQNNMNPVLVNTWIDDISFNLFFKDDEGSIFWRIDPNEAIIDSIYMYKGGWSYGFAIDLSKWRSAQKRQLIEWLGEPLVSMWKEYEKTGIKYVHVPVEYSMVLKFHTDMMDAVIPPMLHNFIPLANLNDLSDTQASADQLSFYRMIYLPLPTMSGAKNPDEFEITPDLAIDYFKVAKDEAIPSGVSSAVIPGKELKTIDFSDNVSDDVNRVENSQQQILGSAGGIGALLNGNKLVNNSALIKAALKSESAYVLNSILPQIETWTNLQLYLNVGKPCKVNLLPVTIHTKEDYQKALLEANQYSYSYRLAYGTLMDISERETMAQLIFETQALRLQDLMCYPLQSSYTTSNDGEKGTVGEGAPEKSPEELSPEGERSRNK